MKLFPAESRKTEPVKRQEAMHVNTVMCVCFACGCVRDKREQRDRGLTLKFCRFMKNCIADFGPMVKVTPEKNSICLSTQKVRQC